MTTLKKKKRFGVLEWPSDKLTHASSVTHWQVASLPAKHCTDCQRETHLFPDLRSHRLLLSLCYHQSSQKKMSQTIFPHHLEWNFPWLKGSFPFIRWSVSTSWFLPIAGPFTNLPSTQNGLSYWCAQEVLTERRDFQVQEIEHWVHQHSKKVGKEGTLWQPLLTFATVSFLWKQSQHLL